MLHNIPGILFLIAGIVGALPIDTRIAWVLVAIAGLLMVLPV